METEKEKPQQSPPTEFKKRFLKLIETIRDQETSSLYKILTEERMKQIDRSIEVAIATSDDMMRPFALYSNLFLTAAQNIDNDVELLVFYDFFKWKMYGYIEDYGKIKMTADLAPRIQSIIKMIEDDFDATIKKAKP